MPQNKRIRNKNPNCNHNSNHTFYQPIYNNVKYDDSYKKKEDVLRKAFFKECVKEEDMGVTNVGMAPNKNDPVSFLKIIEEYLTEQLFLDFEAQQTGTKAVPSINKNLSLINELSLDNAIVP